MSMLRAALVQMTAGPEIEPNLKVIEEQVTKAADAGAHFVLLPENCTLIAPDAAHLRARLFEEAQHPALGLFPDLARRTGTWLLAGSIAVKGADGRAANRSLLFSPDGKLVARYDKIHMFDVDLAGGESYRESERFRPGDMAVVADLPWGMVGLSVCYDLRFAYLYRALAKAGARILTVPAAFTVPTGKAHWHVLLRARAIEAGCFVLAPAQTGTHAGGRRTYGHSLIISPWGEILAEAGEEPEIIMADLDMARVDEARQSVPALNHDRSFVGP
ncbi:carbon-nitrogen hydrolase family protein [Radicibacter daui]|uniref:carbon-nitrogen hydrolase family protein n=1 Tax=Radicibacter daui TaxID=3064829 RepID=UPI004046EEE6